ncbi:hypothetical protein F5Y19DRAFT_345460 [Xylariaceae sp. FL1651]|nr:hypothetical protein F5Y19DRAFT_345460 [Xylariaceae sp. FL1651]
MSKICWFVEILWAQHVHCCPLRKLLEVEQIYLLPRYGFSDRTDVRSRVGEETIRDSSVPPLSGLSSSRYRTEPSGR